MITSLLLSMSFFACGEKEDLTLYCNEDSSQNLIADDADCDGIVTAADCNDSDASSTAVADDADCDGTVTADDCDDNDAASNIIADDGDCDGVLTADDCDDADAMSTVVAEDADCDGTLTEEDCDDSDAMSTIISEDEDCDGTITAEDCNDTDSSSTIIAEDGDCDGVLTADDCDDADATSTVVAEDMDCDGVLTADDCNDMDATSTTVATDGDCDGVLTADDCNDADATSTTVATDSDCDTVINEDDCDDNDVTIGATDADQDGFIDCVNDCDPGDATIGATDADADGFVACVDDCDDNDATIGATDADGDGFVACVDDCDDNSATTYPGAGYNEADASLCVNDADGDGYGMAYTDVAGACFILGMTDTYGDGWNGNAIEVYEDGVLTGTYTNDSSYDGNETKYEQHCVGATTMNASLVFVDGSFNSEVRFALYTDDGTGAPGIMIGMGAGSGTTDFIFNGETFTDGDTFFSNATGGSDCDDSDASTYGDADMDGYTYCTSDCNDNDANVNPGIDGDMDGYSVCDDCNDADANVNPGMTETWYDGVDSDCDGASDYDQDGDGDEVMEFTDANGNTVAWTGYDCNDTSTYYGTLSNEADPTACYYDGDNDGFGDDSLSSTASGYGATEGTDCYDGSAYVYPGAAYNELDVDGDGVTDCTRDYDGDGYGNSAPASYYNASAGTDCNDSDADLSPGMDADMDGYATCADSNGLVDCDDNDGTTYPGAGFNEASFVLGDYSTYECVTDGDSDGYAYGVVSACYVFDLADTYGDGWNGGTSIDVYADGVLVDSAFVDANSADGGYTEMSIICAPNGSVVEFTFNAGTFASEIEGTIYAEDLVTEIGSFTGAGGYSASAQAFNYSDGVSYTDGQTFFTETANGTTLVGGSDANDADPTVH